MEEKRKQVIQKVKNPSTGEMMNLKTYSGKELFWEEEQVIEEQTVGEDEATLKAALETSDKDEEYAKLWEDDRL
jgi:predicted secreted protein